MVSSRTAMPPLGNSLSDEQIAEVVNYVRSHFDNHYGDALTSADVAKLRAPTGGTP